MASYGYTFNSGDGVTPTRLNAARTVSDIVNADIASAAAIDKTKIAGTAITAADTGTVTSAMIADGAIVNADINASAAIAHSKLANITSGQVLLGNASNVPTATALSGDVTVNNSGVTAISSGVIVDADINASAAISLSKLATGALPTAITVASANLVDGTIVNADINASAAIADTKLATISTAGKVSNSATTATSVNTASAIVARDASGNFSAGTITATLSGNVTGNLTGTASAIADASVSDSKVASNAAIAGTKISPNFGSQNIVTTGTISSGAITSTGDITAFSDARLKENVETIADALQKVNALRGVAYTKDGKSSIGLIAQEVQQVVPEVVSDSQEYLSVAYGNLVGLLIEAVKELSAKVDTLQK